MFRQEFDLSDENVTVFAPASYVLEPQNNLVWR